MGALATARLTDLRAAVLELWGRIKAAAGVMRRGDPNTLTTCGACRTGEPCGGDCDHGLRDGRVGGRS